MSAKYLLPCPCGGQTVVEPRQAGQTITCSCGASLPVPTLLGMTALEPAPVEPVAESPHSTWGVKHRLRLVGTVLLLAALVGGIWLYIERPVSRYNMIDPERIQQMAAKLSPLEAWNVWEIMKQGLDRHTDKKYAAAVSRFRLGQTVVGAAALVGIGLIVLSAIGTSGKGRV